MPSESVRPGETVDAEVRITGGSVEQEIGTARFEIETQFRTEDGCEETAIDRSTLAEGLTIDPDQQETKPVSIDIPYRTPVTIGNVSVWIETELDAHVAVDPEDTTPWTSGPRSASKPSST